MAIALVALALVVTWYCKSGKEHMFAHTTMPQHPAAMPTMNVVVPQTAAGLQPAESDSTDYGPFPGESAPCALQSPYAA